MHAGARRGVRVLTLLVGVDAVVGVQLLVPLLLLDRLAEYGVPVYDIDGLLLVRARRGSHA